MKLQHVILCLFYLKGYQMDCKKCISDIVGITEKIKLCNKELKARNMKQVTYSK